MAAAGRVGARLQVTFWRRPYVVVAASGLLRGGGWRRWAAAGAGGEKELGQKGIDSRGEIDVHGRLASRSGQATSPTSQASSLLYGKILGVSRARLGSSSVEPGRAEPRAGSARLDSTPKYIA